MFCNRLLSYAVSLYLPVLSLKKGFNFSLCVRAFQFDKTEALRKHFLKILIFFYSEDLMESRTSPSKGFLQKRMSCAKLLLWKSVLCLYSEQQKDLCRRFILREMETYRLLIYLKLSRFAFTP